MKVYPDYEFANFLTGEPITDPKKPDRVLQLRHVVGAALMQTYDGEPLSGEEMQRRYELGRRIFTATDKAVYVTTVEAAKIKELAARMYKSPLVAGQLWHLLECWAKDSNEAL